MNRNIASAARQRIRKLEEERRIHIETLLGADEMIAGSFVALARKCGKPTCRCATGDGHVSRYLSRSEGGKTHMTYVPARDEVDIARKAERYRQFRQARAELMKLSAQLAEAADELQAALNEAYPPDGAPKGRGRKRATDV